MKPYKESPLRIQAKTNLHPLSLKAVFVTKDRFAPKSLTALASLHGQTVTIIRENLEMVSDMDKERELIRMEVSSSVATRRTNLLAMVSTHGKTVNHTMVSGRMASFTVKALKICPMGQYTMVSGMKAYRRATASATIPTEANMKDNGT